ncbi:MAG: RluA family pseudouridine synthase [Bacilli bacterium]|nr:RluA family pseudouridine synthase [Bacilli bacterium]MDY6362770.1 RluA family pseudouridine synthase [Bacilli bacterium]
MNKFVVDQKLANTRLDKALSELLLDVSRTKIKSYLDDGLILVNNKVEKASYKVEENDVIEVADLPKEETDLNAENIPLNIVYEDDDLMVINKPKGLVVHPGAGNKSGTLANGLKFHSDNLSTINGDFRPGIVHRLDKDTAGLLVVAKNDFTHVKLQEQLVDHTLSRKYYALVLGVISEDNGQIIAPIGRDKQNRQKMAVDLRNGKEAETSFRVLKRFSNSTLVECVLKTGRTHQIRVHMNYIGHPVIGDPLYGKGNRLIYDDGQLLYAHYIKFIHPRTKKALDFDSPMPSYFEDFLKTLK